MVKVVSPSFAFRAERTYLHTTDIYDSLLAGLVEAGFGDADGPVSLTIRKVVRSQPELHFREPGETVPRPPHAVIDFAAHTGKARIGGWFVVTGRPVEERVPYEEEAAIRSRAVVAGQSIAIEGDPGATAIEVVTALAVHLHNTLSPPPPGRKWLVTRLDLQRPLRPADGCRLRLHMPKRRDDRLTKSLISVPGEDLGHIYFSLGSP